MRRIKTRRLIVSGLVYRIIVLLVNSLILLIVTGKMKRATGTALLINTVNICIYYTYHYWFARLVKLGDNNV